MSNSRGNYIPQDGKNDRYVKKDKVTAQPTAMVKADSTQSKVIQLIVTNKDQTGDVYHVAAALAIDPMTDVLYLNSEAVPDTDFVMKFFRQAADASTKVAQVQKVEIVRAQRVRSLAYKQSRIIYQALTWIDKNTPKSVDWILNPKSTDQTRGDTIEKLNKIFPYKERGADELNNIKAFFVGDENKWEYRSISLKKVTLNISQSFTESKSPALIYATIANALASNADGLSMKGKDNKIIWTDKTDFYFGVKDKAKKLPRSPSEQLPILLLWSRYSGSLTPKGYFPEGDSDLRGQKQLLDMANKLQCQVITIGHDPNPELETKTDMDNAHSKDCHLGEFYKTAPITSDRDTQISFFLALMQQYPGRLYQIGQKTGGMDGAALLGIPTIYIECDSINPGARMSGWVDKVPFYRDANIFDPPSLLGKAVFKLRKWMIWEQDNNKITVQDTHASWYKGYESDFYNRILFPRPARFRLIALLYLLGKAITAIDKDLDRKLQGELQMEQERKERAEKYQAKKDPSTGKPSTGKPAIVPPANVDPMMALKIVNSFYPEYVVDEKWDLWMTGLNKLTNEELKPLNTFRGYATADLEKIKDKLTVLLTDYPKPSTIIRNENGEYVTRESNSKK